MVAAPSGRSSRSSKTNPCPICGRNTDGDCELKPDGRVFCNRGSNFAPPPEARNDGDVVPGADGQQWAYLGDTDLGRAMFKPDEGKGKSKTHLRVVSAPSRPLLARLPDGTNLPDLNREKATYVYGPKQETRRAPDGQGGKTVRPWHLKGRKWACSGGPDLWPLYQQDLALQADSWLLETEGEHCVGIAMAAGLVAISQPGHNHTAEAITARYAALVAAGSKVFYIEDNDAEGIKKGARIRDCAAAAGLQLLSVNAAEVWPGIAEKGSIDDAPGTAAEQVVALEAALLRAQSKAPAAKSQQAQQANTTEQASEASTTKPSQHKERKARHMSHSKAMACFDRCIEVQAQRERNSLRRRARLLKAAKDLGLAAFINRQEISQKVLEAKARCGGESFKPLTAADRAAMPKPVVHWLVRGLIPANDLTIIGGRPKVGKTRLAVAIVAAVLRGETFLEFPAATSTPPVLLVTDDQSAGDTATMLTSLGIWDHPRLITSDNFRLTEPDLDALLEAIKANPGALVVIDSLRSIGRSLQHAENDVEIGATLYDLKQSVIDAGGTLLLIHHCNKAADLVGVEALSGHSAISGAANTVITLHHCPNDKGQPDKINPQRRLFSEGRSGEGCDLVIDRGAGAGTYRQVSTFEHWQQQLSEAKKNQKLERLTEMQQQALDALNDSGEWMTRRQVCEAIGVAWSERGRSREARKVGVSLHRLVELEQAESVRAGTEATFRASHETQNDIGTTGPISDASASQWPEAHRATRATRANDTKPELLAQVAQNGRATETDCSDKVARLSRTSQPISDPQRQENEQRIRDHGRNTDLAGWSDSDVFELLQSLDQAAIRRRAAAGLLEVA